VANADSHELRQKLPRVRRGQVASVQTISHAPGAGPMHSATPAPPAAAAAPTVAAVVATLASTAAAAAVAVALAVVASSRRLGGRLVCVMLVVMVAVVEPPTDGPPEGGEHAPAQLDPPHEPHVPLHRYIEGLGHA